MRRPAKGLISLLAVLVVAMPALTDARWAAARPASAVAGASDDDRFLVGTADVGLIPEGRKGKVVVVANGPADERSGSVPVVLRNNTKKPITSIEVQGAARDGSGELVGSGGSQGIDPATVAPGGIGIGYVYFGFDAAPLIAGATFEFKVSSERSLGPKRDYFAAVEILEHNVANSQIVGIVRNPLRVTVSGPVNTLVMCFDESGAPLHTASDFVEAENLRPRAESSFAVDLFDDPCPTYLVGASGFNEQSL